jgi:DNA-binding NarL/FixJ family response regulator
MDVETSNLTDFRVVLVDDNPDFAYTLRDLLSLEKNIQVVGIALNEADFRALILSEMPDLALIDLGLSHSKAGLGLLSWLARDFPAVKPVVMTSSEEDVLACYQAGARGYVLKSHPETLAATLRNVQAGQLIIPPQISAILMRQVLQQATILRQTQELARLTDREKEILRLLQKGVSRDEIAEKLQISFYTVRRHLQNALEKARVDSVKSLLESYKEALGGP